MGYGEEPLLGEHLQIVLVSLEVINQVSSYHPFLKRQVMVEQEYYGEDLQQLR